MSYNPMVLGVDISTSKIGLAVIDSNNKIVVSEVIKMKPENTLEEKAVLFENKLLKLKKYYFYDIYKLTP